MRPAIELLGGIPFGIASFIRGARIFHPRGIAFAGDLELDEVGAGRSLATNRRERVTVRLSNAAGFPGRFPDVRGFAFRIHDAHGRGRHQDLMLATGARRAGLRNMLLPAAKVSSSFFSSILPYAVEGRIVVFGASADGSVDARSPEELRDQVSEGPVAFDLLVAGLVGPWRRIGRVRLQQALSARQSARLAFNPWNTGSGVRPIGVLNALRDPAYRWSQAARRLRGERGDTALRAVDPAPSIERIPISG